MATLSKHGGEVGRIAYLTKIRAYMEDGTVLVHDGTGWRQLGKVKEGVTPREALAKAQQRHKDHLENNYFLAAYRKALHNLAPQSKRYLLHSAVEMMPGDPDGVWSELADHWDPRQRISADLDEIVELCGLYESAQAEASRAKDGANLEE